VQLLDFAACFHLSTVDEHVVLSNDSGLLFRDLPAHLEEVIDLTMDDEKNGEEDDAPEVS
jgi:hypothetical protein